MTDGLNHAVRLYTFAMLGMFLLVTPWTPIWDRATLSLLPAAAGAWARSGWVRGSVSGLGVLDLVAAATEAGWLWRSFRSTT